MEPLDTDVVNLAKAIRQQESGGNFNAIGDNGDSKGAYQFNKGNFNVWAKQYLGDENLPFTPENQNKVAYHRIKDLKSQGYNPGQIAAIWNSGQPDVNVVPEYVQNVYRNYQQLKGTSTPQTVSQPIEETRQGRIEQGLPVSVNPAKAAPTKAGEFVRGLIKPVATLLARPYQLGLAIGGASPEKQTIHSQYLGDITAPTTAKDVVKDIGRGLETVSLGIGGGGAANLAKGVTKEAITKLAVQGAKEGALAGALGSGGAAIEEGKPVGKVLGQTALGTATGGTIGGVLGVAAPLAARGISTATKGTGTALKATGLIKSTAEDAEKAVRSVAEEYERAAGTGLPNSFRKSQKTRAGELKPWNQTLAEYGIVPQEGIDKSWDVENALTDIDTINDEFAKTKANFIKNENARFNIDEALRVADSKIDASTPSEVARNKAKAKIREEVDAVLAKSKPEINDAGERLLTAQDIERIRDIGYSLTPFDAADPQKIGKAAGYSLAKAVNETIDKYSTFPGYRSFNREWSNILNAQEALEHLKTKKVRLSKGLSGQIAMKALGPIFGYSKGGIIGAILGDLGADTAGRLLSDPQLRTMVQRSIIQKAGQKMPKDKIIGALEKEIADYVANQVTLPQLPAAGQTSAPLYGTGEIKTPQSIRQEESAMKAGQEMFKRQGLLKNAGISSDLEPLFQEARKYKSAEEFVKAKTTRPDYGYGHSPNEDGVRAFNLTEKVDGEQMIPEDMYTQWYGSRGTPEDLESIAVLKKIKGNPEAEVTIYRASPKDEWNYGDWITFSKRYAQSHAEGNNLKVFSKKVKAKDVRWAMDDINEFGYFPEDYKSQLTDLYNKAVGKERGLLKKSSNKNK